MPMATPDVEKTLLAIQDKIKPDQYSNFGYQPVMIKDSEGNDVHTGEYTLGTETTKYSNADVRAKLTSHFLQQIPEYSNYAEQQYDLGLSPMGRYDKTTHGGLMDIEAMINPLLQPLSKDITERNDQLARAGVQTEADYLHLQNIERANREAIHNQTIQKTAKQFGVTPEEAEEALAAAEYKRLSTTNILDRMGSASCLLYTSPSPRD